MSNLNGREGASIPVVEMRIRAMGEEVISAVMLRADEIAERVRLEVERTVKNFDFESYVRSETEAALRRFMTEGAGHDAVCDLAFELGDVALSRILKRIALARSTRIACRKQGKKS